jgi:hypothetical protein
VLRKALRPSKHRTPSTATKSSKEERLSKKKERGSMKKLRRLDLGKELD